MRKIGFSLLAASLAVLATACGSSSGGTTSTTSGSGGTSATAVVGPLGASCSPSQLHLYKAGQLTVATDAPAYTPWFENNKPSNGKGYESAVAYAVAKELGFKASQVQWVVEPFDNSYTPGPKKFDFDINEISYTPQRAQQVTFSVSYYDVTQALVAMKGTPIVTHHSPSELKTYLYGDQIGTTSLQFIQSKIQPTQQTHVFNTLNDVKSALDNHRIDAFVTDTPTAQYITTGQMPGTTVVGQFAFSNEYYGLLFQKGNPLVGCVNKAITALRSNGTLTQLQHEYLGIYTSIPTIQP